MICVISMVVFGFLGIFSLGYRQIAKEAFDCVFRRVTFRPCQTGFDQKMKTKITSRLMPFPKVARFTYKNFEAISWVFTILLFSSMAYTGYGVFNLVAYGTCDPITGNCVFNPNGAIKDNPYECQITGEFVEFYGDGCPHCARMAPVLEKIESETDVEFQKLEVYKNKTNQEEMLRHAENIEQECGLLGVPVFYAVETDKAVCGEVSEKELKAFIAANG